MATTLRAFTTLFKDINNTRLLEGRGEGDYSSSRGDSYYSRATNAATDGSSIRRSLVYKMYKRVVSHAVDETSSEMTFDCSSFSEHDYYDLEDYDDFGGVYFKEGSSIDDHIMTFSPPPPAMRTPNDSSVLLPSSSSSPSSSSVETPRLSYYETHQDWKTSFADADDAFLLHELADRASSLLQRESCSDYMIKNYFRRLPGCCPRFPSSGHTAVAPAVDSSDSSSPTTPSGPNLPIDSKCRSIMMNWSFRVVEFALLNLEGRHRQQMKARLLSRTFSYVDRICTKFDIANRDQYKLLTIVCLHLAAKVSGLLKSNDQVNHDCNEGCQHRGCSDDTVSTSVSMKYSSSSPSTTSSAVMSVESQQTIVPTPYSYGSVADSSLPLQEEDQQQDEPSEQAHSTEYIWLLSLHGLHSLSHDEFTMDELKQMECTILNHGLDWRLSSVVALDWVGIYLEVMVLSPPPLLLRCSNDDLDGMNDTCGKKNFLSFTKEECDDIRDATLTQLEYALKRPCTMGCAHSLLGLATFLNVMKGYSSIGSNDFDLVLLSSIEGAIGLSVDYDELYDLQVKMLFQQDDDDECMA